MCGLRLTADTTRNSTGTPLPRHCGGRALPVFLGEELGARPKDPACYVDGHVDFGRLAARGQFKRGI